MDTEKAEPRQSPLPMGVAVFKPLPRPVSAETVRTLERLLREAREGKVAGLATVVLHADGRFDLHLKGSRVFQRDGGVFQNRLKCAAQVFKVKLKPRRKRQPTVLNLHNGRTLLA